MKKTHGPMNARVVKVYGLRLPPSQLANPPMGPPGFPMPVMAQASPMGPATGPMESPTMADMPEPDQ